MERNQTIERDYSEIYRFKPDETFFRISESKEAEHGQDEHDDKTPSRGYAAGARELLAESSRSAWSRPSRIRRTVPLTAKAGTIGSQRLKMR